MTFPSLEQVKHDDELGAETHDLLAAARKNPETYARLESMLLDENAALHVRFRALFTLRSLADDKSVEIISKGFKDPSALLRHELAYVLGQMRNPTAIPILSSVLETLTEEPMVRHEAGEALGAIGSPESLPLLEKYVNDPRPEVSETCQIAVDLIKHEVAKKSQASSDAGASNENTTGPYLSVDPAPPTPKVKDAAELQRILMDDKLSLFERYRAMFALRNKGDSESVLALASGLKDSSALFRHEIAYVLGQIQHPAAIDALHENLSDANENAMVRHECAEALGSIATPKCLPIIEKFSKDPEMVVRESCLIALDMWEHENDTEQFQYANGLSS